MSTSTLHRTGLFRGTGADLEVSGDKVGFRPTRVEVKNLTQNTSAWWAEDMADDSMSKTITDGTQSLVTANGITPVGSGFQLGADTLLNGSEDEIHFECWG